MYKSMKNNILGFIRAWKKAEFPDIFILMGI